MKITGVRWVLNVCQPTLDMLSVHLAIPENIQRLMNKIVRTDDEMATICNRAKIGGVLVDGNDSRDVIGSGRRKNG